MFSVEHSDSIDAYLLGTEFSYPAPRLPAHNPLIPTVFHNPWWLDAASCGRYKEVDIQSSGKVIARLPYVFNRTLGSLGEVHMPELTHFLGPAIDAGQRRAANQLLRNYDLTRELISKIERFQSFYQTFHRGISDTLAFHDAGYSSFSSFTYEIEPQSAEALWKKMRDKTRNAIRRAAERSSVTTMTDAYAFEAFYKANLRERGMPDQYLRIGALCQTALEKGQGRILAAIGRDSRLIAAIFTPWDDQVAYHLLSTRSLHADNGAVSLLLWSAIRAATEGRLTFDFDGIGPAGNRLFYTGFGGTIKPRYSVAKSSYCYRALRAVKDLWFRVGN
jgi:lipid II:glycine glycyltransferase (peptidoglycan interpeptide bridge formation enzyme)